MPASSDPVLTLKGVYALKVSYVTQLCFRMDPQPRCQTIGGKKANYPFGYVWVSVIRAVVEQHLDFRR